MVFSLRAEGIDRASREFAWHRWERQLARNRLTCCRHRSRPPEHPPKVREYNKGQSLDSQREQYSLPRVATEKPKGLKMYLYLWSFEKYYFSHKYSKENLLITFTNKITKHLKKKVCFCKSVIFVYIIQSFSGHRILYKITSNLLITFTNKIAKNF